MKTLRVLVLGAVLPFSVHAQLLREGHLSVGGSFGSIRNRYFYPLTDLHVGTWLPWFNLGFQGHLRSYGYRSIANVRTYDLAWAGSYHLKLPQEVDLSAGGGTELRLRFVKDERSRAATSMEPFLLVGASKSMGRFTLEIPTWSRFYNDGFAMAILPQPSVRVWDDRISLNVRLELNYLRKYAANEGEWRRETFFGAMYHF